MTIEWETTDYDEGRNAYADAWERDDGVTNYRLKDGDAVELVCKTIATGSHSVVRLASGTRGVVKHARTPRVNQPRIRKPRTYIYFANVDVMLDSGVYRARVPHNALRRIKESP